MMTNLMLGPDGNSIASLLDAKTYSWTASASKSESFCSEHFPWLSGAEDSPTHISTHWLKAQSGYHFKCGADLPVDGKTESHKSRRQ